MRTHNRTIAWVFPHRLFDHALLGLAQEHLALGSLDSESSWSGELTESGTDSTVDTGDLPGLTTGDLLGEIPATLALKIVQWHRIPLSYGFRACGLHKTSLMVTRLSSHSSEDRSNSL